MKGVTAKAPRTGPAVCKVLARRGLRPPRMTARKPECAGPTQVPTPRLNSPLCRLPRGPPAPQQPHQRLRLPWGREGVRYTWTSPAPSTGRGHVQFLRKNEKQHKGLQVLAEEGVDSGATRKPGSPPGPLWGGCATRGKATRLSRFRGGVPRRRRLFSQQNPHLEPPPRRSAPRDAAGSPARALPFSAPRACRYFGNAGRRAETAAVKQCGRKAGPNAQPRSPRERPPGVCGERLRRPWRRVVCSSISPFSACKRVPFPVLPWNRQMLLSFNPHSGLARFV